MGGGVARVKSGLKTAAPAVLPESLLHQVKKQYYRWSVPRVSAQKEPSFWHLPRFVRPGDEVVDVGANFGVYSCVLSRLVGKKGKVFAFEPVPSTFSILQYVAHSFPAQNCCLFQSAVGQREELSEMEVPRYQGGGENYYRARVVADEEQDESTLRRFHVLSTTLDKALLPLSRRVSFLKVDVEGRELAVVRGAVEILARDRPVCLIEVTTNPDTPQTEGAELFRLLERLGYEAHIIQAERVLPRTLGRYATDYLFLPSNQGD